jgi:hypothetical protein
MLVTNRPQQILSTFASFIYVDTLAQRADLEGNESEAEKQRIFHLVNQEHVAISSCHMRRSRDHDQGEILHHEAGPLVTVRSSDLPVTTFTLTYTF